MKVTKWIFVFCILFCVGCEMMNLRHAPKEEQKKLALLTHQVAAKIESEGTVPGSPAAKQVARGTRAAVTYLGPPKTMPSIEAFETIAPMAESQAEMRPDVWKLTDSALELGIGITALVGGAYGIKAVKFLKEARQKSKALQEIVAGNELFKDSAFANGAAKLGTEQQERFKAAHNDKQSAETKKVVALVKTGAI